LSPAARLSAGTYNVEGPLIVRVNDPGGFSAPVVASSAASGIGIAVVDIEDNEDVPSAGVQDSDADAASGVQDSDEESQEARVATRQSRVGEINSPGKSLEDINALAQQVLEEEREEEERRQRNEDASVEPERPDWSKTTTRTSTPAPRSTR
jgi:hypothetical protein